MKLLELLVLVLALAYPVGWLVSETRWSYVNNPADQFNNITEYLAQNRQPSRVSKVQVNDTFYIIAYSPTDYWLAIPSGPAAYVFDKQGQMVEWSYDSGEDQDFQKSWQSLQQQEITIEELNNLRE